jgi:glutathione peroxidase
MNTIYQHKFKTIDNIDINLADYQNNILLIVNTASYCGFTYQFESLQAIYDEFKDQGLVVIGFPTNNFGGQDPDPDQEILNFCHHNFDVNFPMIYKTDINKNTLYADLLEQSGILPNWNFNKYLIDKNANSIQFFSREVEPTVEIREVILQLIQK